MPATTPNRGYPYPAPTDPVDVPGDLQRLAEAIDDDLEAVSALIRPRKAAQARSSQSLVVQPNVLQTLVPFDTMDWDTSTDADRFFRLTSNPYTLTLVPGQVYWVYASIRFPSVNNTGIGDNCRIEIISPTPSGTFVLCDNSYTEDVLIEPDVVHAASMVQPTNVNNQWRVSVRHNFASGSRVFTEASFGVFQV